MKINIVLVLSVLLSACATSPKTLYQEVGGQDTVAHVTEYFIDEISFNPEIYRYFRDTDIERFRNKFSEHFCVQLNGPCRYTGDDMEQIHRGMNITEKDFNLLVDLLINAMGRAGLSHRQQNSVLSKLAPMRSSMLYH